MVDPRGQRRQEYIRRSRRENQRGVDNEKNRKVKGTETSERGNAQARRRIRGDTNQNQYVGKDIGDAQVGE